MFEIHVHSENILMVNGRATEMIDGLKKPHFVPGQNESGPAKKPRRIAEDVFRLSPHHLTCWMQIAIVQFTKIASEHGSGRGAACSATSKLEKNSTFGYGQVTTPTPSENWKPSYELSL